MPFYIEIIRNDIVGRSELDNSRFYDENYYQIEVDEETYNNIENYKLDINNKMLVKKTDEEIEKEHLQKERERLNMLSLTVADVERAIYKAKGIDFEDILNLVKDNPDIDLKALKIELKANNFYRGNPYINQIGAILGFTEKQLDEFFETNDYTKLLAVEDKNGELPKVVEENSTSDDKLPM